MKHWKHRFFYAVHNLFTNLKQWTIFYLLINDASTVYDGKKFTSFMLQSVSERCDQWCLSHHRNGRCPSQYDAADNAASKHFHRLKELIEAIRDGRRKPGDGLTDFMAYAAFTPQPPGEKKPKTDKVRTD